MPTTTAIATVINYLVDTFTAASGIGGAGVLVIDGQGVTQDYTASVLWVGMSDPDATPGNVSTGASATQEWAALGRLARNEMGTVYLAAQGWDGGGDMRTARTTAFAIQTAVEAVVRADANLGGNVLVVLPGVTGHLYRSSNTSEGAKAQILFNVAYKARLV